VVHLGRQLEQERGPGLIDGTPRVVNRGRPFSKTLAPYLCTAWPGLCFGLAAGAKWAAGWEQKEVWIEIDGESLLG